MLDYLVNHLGYLGIVAFLALCGCGIPVPEEAPLVLAGVLSSQGTLKPWLAFSACLSGALLGDSMMYFIGRRLGHSWLTQHKSVARFINADKEEMFEHAVGRHGFKVLLLTRFLVGVRGPVYYAAGAAKVPYLRFLLWDLVSATLVVGVVFGLGYRFGEPIAKIIHNAEELLTIGVVLVLASVGLFFLYKSQTKRMAAALQEIAQHDAEAAAREKAESGGVAHADAAADFDDSHEEDQDSDEPNAAGRSRRQPTSATPPKSISER
ncbi:DedA family protein [Botrimarina hoheduenensis]|uniref:Inner membrane protein YohD n=1 Tax=Botrimarina hoheduenensis TaxID=2528000 RepID=A0A5C5WAV0_9BACT|nr:DedA family protein [Botrimarina hoheduenensis]TWT47295.1 Inner membrane protein YohD [Botrimarina hoheduenensis]